MAQTPEAHAMFSAVFVAFRELLVSYWWDFVWVLVFFFLLVFFGYTLIATHIATHIATLLLHT